MRTRWRRLAGRMASAQSGGPSPRWKGRWLFIIGIAAVLPLAALAAFASWRDQQLERLRAHAQVHALSEVAAKSAEGFVARTQAMLVALARDPSLVGQQPEAARQALRERLAAFPEYTALSAARADGLVYADPQAPPGTPAANIAGERYFQEAMQGGCLSIRALVVEDANGRHIRLVFCQPVRDQAGRPIGTLQAFCDPAAVQALAAPAPLPAGASVVLIDGDGTIFLCSGQPALCGRKVAPQQAATLGDGETGAKEELFLGQAALVGTSPVRAAAWRAAVVMPAERALSGWKAATWGLGAGFALALGVGLLLSGRVASLGQQARQQQGFLAALVESASVGVAVACGPDNRLEFANPVYYRITGRPPEAVIGRPLREVFPPPVDQMAEGYIAEVRRSGRAVRAREVAVESGEPRRLTFWDIDYLPLPRAEGEPSAVLMLAVPVTERVLARRQAEEQAAQLQAVLGSIHEAVLVFDAAGHLAYANQAACRLAGTQATPCSPGEIEALIRSMELYWPDGRPAEAAERGMQRALAGQAVAGQEMQYRLPGQKRRRWLRTSSAPVRDAQGHISGAVVTASDITDQKEAGAERERLLDELRAAHENLRAILDSLPDGVLVVDAGQRVTLCNQTVIRYLGRDPTGVALPELRRKHGFVMADGRPFPPGQSPVERSLRGETVTGVEAQLLHLDGEPYHVLESTAPLYGAEGRIAGAITALTNITALKETEAERERLLGEVQTAREELLGIINRLPDGVLVIDPSLRARLCNDTLRAYIGRDVTGEPVPALWKEFHFAAGDGRPFPPGQTPVERALRGETVVGIEVSFDFPNGRHVDALDSAAAVYNPDGTVREVAMVFTDITPLKELDRAKDEFISFAAHELRTPLTALKGHAQILLRRAERAGWPESDQRSLRVIDAQVDRLNELIGRLLDVSRIRLGRLQLSRQPTDLVALAREVAEELQVTTTVHRIRIYADVPELVGNWDPSALRQVLTNLIGNAIRYANPGPIDVRVSREDGQAVVRVTDYGPGIPPERQARIFEAFRPGAAAEYRRAGGLGLGLYISRGIVEAHGGRIWVESQVGVGSTFGFSLPLARYA